jgi:hypothetical protein
MALTKVTIIDKIEIVENGSVHVRRATYVEENGARIAGPMYHRNSYVPGTNLDHEEAQVQAHAATAWTPEVIQKYQDSMAALDG